MTRSQRTVLQAAAAGYLVVGVFGLAYFVTREGVGETMQVSTVVGAIIAAPLGVGFLWNRMSSVSAFGVRVELKEFRRTVDRSIAVTLSETQYFSAKEPLIAKVHDVTQKPNLKLIEINLRSEPYWWSTRIYLQAALLESFASHIERLVFVEGDQDRRFIGMASPSAVRLAFARSAPTLERVRATVWSDATGFEGDGARARIETLVHSWAASNGFDEHSEIDFKHLVDAEELVRVMGRALETASIKWIGQEDETLRRLVLTESNPYVAIADHGALQSVVDAAGYTRQVAIDALRHNTS